MVIGDFKDEMLSQQCGGTAGHGQRGYIDGWVKCAAGFRGTMLSFKHSISYKKSFKTEILKLYFCINPSEIEIEMFVTFPKIVFISVRIANQKK